MRQRLHLTLAFGLLGTGSFALFCFYLIMCVIKGNVKLGLRLLIFSVYPMVGCLTLSHTLRRWRCVMLGVGVMLGDCVIPGDLTT